MREETAVGTLRKLWWCPHWETLNEQPHDGQPCTDAAYYRAEEVDALLRQERQRSAELVEALTRIVEGRFKEKDTPTSALDGPGYRYLEGAREIARNAIAKHSGDWWDAEELAETPKDGSTP